MQVEKFLKFDVVMTKLSKIVQVAIPSDPEIVTRTNVVLSCTLTGDGVRSWFSWRLMMMGHKKRSCICVQINPSLRY